MISKTDAKFFSIKCEDLIWTKTFITFNTGEKEWLQHRPQTYQFTYWLAHVKADKGHVKMLNNNAITNEEC